MSNEATINCSLTINKNNLKYRSGSGSFRADLAGEKGPVPGAINVPVSGVDVDLSELTTPGLCEIINLSTTNYVEVGIWDGASFFPLLELLPGEKYVLRLARNLGNDYGSGTGTTGSGNTLRLNADTSACDVVVAAFEK